MAEQKPLVIPIPSMGLDKYNEPIYNAPTTPFVQNMNIFPTVVKKRSGSIKLGLNLPLKGTGMEVLQHIDGLGAYHTIAMTTTNAALFNGSTKMWEVITPGVALEDCEDVWVAGSGDTIAVDATAGEYVRGSKSVKITLASAAADGDKLAYEDFSAINLTNVYVDYDSTGIQLTEISFWIKSSIALAPNAFELVVSEAANGAKTGTVDVNYSLCLTTALAADTWTFVQLTKTLTSLNAVVSVALYANATIADGTIIRIDDVRAHKIFTGTDSDRWSYGMVYDSAEFANGDAALFISNDVDKPLCYEGASGDTFKQHANDLANFTTTKELIEFWNHLIYLHHSVASKVAKGFAYADFGDCDDWTTGTFGAGILTDSIGAILRARKLKADLVVYSEESISIGKYVGDPYIFVWPTLVTDTGLFAERALYSFKDFHYFLGNDNKVYMYEGNYYLKSVGDLIEDALFQEIDALKAKYIVTGIDPMEHRVHFAFADSTASYADRSYAINYKRQPNTWEYHKFVKTIRGFSKYKNEYGWACNGPEVSGIACNATILKCNDTRTQEGGPSKITISDDGYVYQWNAAFSTEDGTNFECILDSGDVVAPSGEYLDINEFRFEAKSAIPNSTCDVRYSTDGGKTWSEKIETITIASGDAGKWDWHVVPGEAYDFDVTARMCRFRIEQYNSGDIQIRRRSCTVGVRSAKD